MSFRKQSGFTLIELSLVIVIIGLIVAGVTAGQSLVRSSKLRSVITDKDKYVAAINTFKLEYNALPGDLQTASSYFSGSLNGNGNGLIDYTGANAESLQAWVHLARAGLISGTYTGTGASLNFAYGTNAPITNLTSTYMGWVIYAQSAASYYGLTFTGNILNLGGYRYPYSTTPATARHVGGTMTAREGQSIDVKIDDGNPAGGQFIQQRDTGSAAPYDTSCVDQNIGTGTTSNTSYVYDNYYSCRLLFFLNKR